MEASDLKAITVARKPLIGTVASNTLKHGCGGINIDASRVAGVWSDPKPRQTDDMRGGNYAGGNSAGYREGRLNEQHSQGRWPANLILQHLDGCRCDGTKRVKGSELNHRCSSESVGGIYSPMGTAHKRGHTDKDGKETIANWICVEGCPVRALDEQSGSSTSAGGRIANISKTSTIYGGGKGLGQALSFEEVRGDPGFGDTGGASRYFKNLGVGEKLTDYLRQLITPPDGDVRIVPLEWGLPESISEGCTKVELVGLQIHGIIALGTPTPDQAQRLYDALLPGGYLLLIAPEDEPTGHTGTCRIEDAGFEIRDSILLVLGAGGFWYVPKPSRAERDAGCGHLSKTGAEAVGRVEGSAGTKSPSAGAGRTTSTVGNHHPTVKPAALMAKLIKGSGQPVLDPFMGSGSTGIGAVLTGHDFIGIEREAEYMEVADARIRHWADSEWRGRIVEVSSDHEAGGGEAPELDMADLFGFGGAE
jgi:hypothetical protein